MALGMRTGDPQPVERWRLRLQPGRKKADADPPQRSCSAHPAQLALRQTLKPAPPEIQKAACRFVKIVNASLFAIAVGEIEDFAEVQRLVQHMFGAFAHFRATGFHEVAGADDDVCGRVFGFDLFRQFRPAHARHAMIQERQIHRVLLQKFQRRARGLAHFDAAARTTQQIREQITFVRFIVHDQHAEWSFSGISHNPWFYGEQTPAAKISSGYASPESGMAAQ